MQWLQTLSGQKKFIIASAIGMLTFILLFVGLLQLSMPKQGSQQTVAPLIDNQSAMDMIRVLEQGADNKAPKPKEKQTTINKPTPAVQQATIFDADKLPEHVKLGNEAGISVYRGERRARTQEITAYSSGTTNAMPSGNAPELPDEYKQQNQQRDKKAFAGETKSNSILSYQAALSPLTIKAGSVIPATLQVEINSDLPGTIMATVRQSVYDSVTGEHILIPQGSTLVGEYDSSIAYGQERVLIAWQRLLLPNGDSMDLQGQGGVDGLGAAGLHDKVNHHMVRVFGSSLAFSLFSAAPALTENNHDDNSLSSALSESLGQQFSQAGMTLLSKNLNVQPTLVIRAGTRFNVLLRQDLVFPSGYSGD